MGTNIGWTDETWSAIVGCTRASDGCRNCYSERFMARFSGIKGHKFEGISKFTKDGPRWSGEIRFAEEALREPLHWRKPRKVFVCSISDLFHEKVKQEWIDKIFAVMAMCPQHTFQVLTKRTECMRDYLRHQDVAQRISQEIEAVKRNPRPATVPGHLQVKWPLSNVWIGTSVENQKTANERIPLLLETPAVIRWISAEPLLSPIDLNAMSRNGASDEITAEDDAMGPPLGGVGGIDWVIAGGESGPDARPMHPAWARNIRDQCVEAEVAFNFKQWGNWIEGHSIDGFFWYKDANGEEQNLSGDTWAKIHYWEYEKGMSFKVGKKVAGRRLDGKIWDEYPKEAVPV